MQYLKKKWSIGDFRFPAKQIRIKVIYLVDWKHWIEVESTLVSRGILESVLKDFPEVKKASSDETYKSTWSRKILLGSYPSEDRRLRGIGRFRDSRLATSEPLEAKILFRLRIAKRRWQSRGKLRNCFLYSAASETVVRGWWQRGAFSMAYPVGKWTNVKTLGTK